MFETLESLAARALRFGAGKAWDPMEGQARAAFSLVQRELRPGRVVSHWCFNLRCAQLCTCINFPPPFFYVVPLLKAKEPAKELPASAPIGPAHQEAEKPSRKHIGISCPHPGSCWCLEGFRVLFRWFQPLTG
ncbi:unnamed protein product [Effrenium voratum]|nr:unnamed protein product [Effrenium voratum]